jgi:hypothetical protein
VTHLLVHSSSTRTASPATCPCMSVRSCSVMAIPCLDGRKNGARVGTNDSQPNAEEEQCPTGTGIGIWSRRSGALEPLRVLLT